MGGLALTNGADLETEYFDRSERAPILATACAALAAPGNDAIHTLLERHADLYQELLTLRFERLIHALNAG